MFIFFIDLFHEEKAAIFVAGWGRAIDEIPKEIFSNRKLDVIMPNILRKKKLELVDMKICKYSWANALNAHVDDSNICATSLISNVPGTCSGDSGSPLMRLDLNNSRSVVIGIGKSLF